MGVSQVQKGGKRRNVLELFSIKPSFTKSGKKTGLLFSQCMGISIVSHALSARKLLVVDRDQGAADIQDHISTKSHQELAKVMATKSRLSHTFELCHIKNYIIPHTGNAGEERVF